MGINLFPHLCVSHVMELLILPLDPGLARAIGHVGSDTGPVLGLALKKLEAWPHCLADLCLHIMGSEPLCS